MIFSIQTGTALAFQDKASVQNKYAKNLKFET